VTIKELAKQYGISTRTALRYKKEGVDLTDSAAVEAKKREGQDRQFSGRKSLWPADTTRAPKPQTTLGSTLANGADASMQPDGEGLQSAIARLRRRERELSTQADRTREWLEVIEGLRKVEKDKPSIEKENAESLTTSEVREKWALACSAVRSALDALPARMALLLEGLDVNEIEEKLERKVESILTNLESGAI
jgi:hypothetical protein